jgi:predicted MFS family arabinose efflux permease
LAAGCLLLAASGARTPAGAPARASLAGPLAVPGFRVLLGIVLATSLGLGAIDVTITARSVDGRHPGAAGYILAALSLGSALGGLAWGKLRHRSRTSTQMTCLLAAMAGGIALSALTPDLLLAGVLLALTGTVLAPSAVLSYLSAERLAGPGAEASTWVNTAWNAGVAAGFALTGLAVGRAGTTVPMLAGAAVLVCAACAVLTRRNIFDGGGATR